jgi:hypothetical protein
MCALETLIADLRDLEADLHEHPDLARRVHDITGRLLGDDVLWVDAARARALLGVQWEKTVEAWADLGLLRSRREEDGTLRVLLEDVLRQREVYHDLGWDWDNRELSPEEYEMLRQTRDSPLPPDQREALDALIAEAKRQAGHLGGGA